jgi:hypothetical protein
MLSDFRFRRGGVLTRVLEATTILAILIMGGCKATNVVTIGPPAQVAFTVQPGNVGAGSSITPAVVVSIEDSHGHVVPTATNQVTIAIGTNPASGTLSGTATVTAVAGVATFSNLSINNVGTGYTLAASATGLTGATSSAFSVVGPPTKLGFTVQPSNVAAGSSIAPSVTVSVEDANGNVVPTATNSITVAIGTNPASGTLGGTATASAVNGVATFANLNINKVGTGYTLTATTSGLTGATSSAFNVTPGAAAKLVFTTQPTNTTAGVAISPAVVVTIEDSLGNVATSATNSITMGIGTGSGSLLGTTSVNATSGVATFSNLSINLAGTGYTLAASATGLTAATSNAFNVTVGAVAKVVFTTQPSNVAAGISIAPAVVVSVEDAVGNVVPTATNPITVAIGANPASGTLSGTATVVAAAGVATFSNLSINKIGTGYTLTAVSGVLTGATSTAFNVTVGVAAQLVVTTQPTNTTAGVAINPAVKVTVEDSQGNVVNNASNSDTIAIGNNPASGTLTGVATVAAVSGVATFSNLNINAAGTGYTLAAASGSLTGATSSSFNILVGAASKLVFTAQPTSATAGVAISPAVQVTIEDNQGNVVNATTSVSMAIGTNPTSAALNGATSVAAVAGVATFSTLSINSAANGYTLVASVSGLSGATSSAFNITAASAAKLAFTGEPINTVVSTDINPSVTVSIEDSFGNVVTTASTPSITLAIGANPGSGTLGGTVTASPSSGVATFSNLTINATGNGYTLTASGSGLTAATSSVFNIIVSIGPPAKLAFTVEPTNAVAGASIAPTVQVSIEDSNGNTVPTATNTVTLSFATTPSGGAVLSGTLSVAAVSGVAKFTNLSINVAATGYNLQAASGSLTGATSTSFNITTGSAAKLAFTVQPSSVASQASINPAVAVSIEDAFGNLVPSATNQITVAIQNNPSSGVLGGTLTATASGGVATFSNLTIDKAGTGYTLSATSSPLTSATSSSFNVTAGSATQLLFTVQPSNVPANSSISPAVQVSIEDAQGNVTSATTQVTVAIGSNPASGTLSGTVAVNAVNGVATFSTLSINTIGTGYTLTASASPLTPATSNSFNVTSADPCAGAGTGSESLLKGQYDILLKGFDNEATPEPALIGGVLAFNGTNSSGSITSGVIDMNLNSGMQSDLTVTAGTYEVGSDHRVCMAITTSAGTQHFRGSIGNISAGVASTGHLIGFDTAGPFTAGVLRKQSSTVPTTLSGNFAFGSSSIQNTSSQNGNGGFGGSFAAVGIITFASNLTITGGSVDFNQNGFLDGNSVVGGNWPSPTAILSGGSYSIASNGRGTMTFTTGGIGTPPPINAVVYVVSSSEILLLGSDAQASSTIFAGSALLQSGTPFSVNPLSGSYIAYQSSLGNTTGTTSETLLRLSPSGTGITGTQLRNDGGSFQLKSLPTGITYSVAGSGRMTVAQGGTGNNPPIFYLVSVNQAFLLSSDTSVGFGFVQSQTSTSASGTYAFGTVDPEDSSLSDNSGVAVFATPNVNVTEDDNSNGSQNADQTQAFTYSVDSTGLGGIPSGCTNSSTSTTCSTVFYVISPTKAVVMDTATTNPKAQVADQ